VYTMEVKLFSTTPHEKDDMWQLVIIPTISVVRCKSERYTVVNFEWLFWNLSILIHDKRRVPST
jgi:hypothetical protein